MPLAGLGAFVFAVNDEGRALGIHGHGGELRYRLAVVVVELVVAGSQVAGRRSNDGERLVECRFADHVHELGLEELAIDRQEHFAVLVDNPELCQIYGFHDHPRVRKSSPASPNKM